MAAVHQAAIRSPRIRESSAAAFRLAMGASTENDFGARTRSVSPLAPMYSEPGLPSVGVVRDLASERSFDVQP